ncbi:hypothetical protein HWC53_gp131 [Bacillus phage vB_BmeM-Goe8]|uniref:Uncharacterized protein n=1 Tax=Bacillus phage vB_BmeM-Goe8 TaxID=2593638 RepID=A0A516KMX7_9CAUD|nr:hypothetical protein HWC53_gp131 [Bacillus phage vB_BmeM-Goe8]QDP42958.1 hypothetical protein Goe8_c01850 [Bacillus phage vB_BmeM-Goe8]
MSNLFERVQKMLDEYKQKVKKNPRHNIEFLADEFGHIGVYFNYISLKKYNRGEATFGSTERIGRSDFVVLVPVERIEKISDGNVVVHTRDWK